MGASAAALVSVVALEGCTLLSLDELTEAGATGTGGSAGGAGPSAGGGGAGPGGGGGGGAGGREPDGYEACIVKDNPAIFFRMDAPGPIEPNLGSFLGDGSYVGPNVSSPGLVGATSTSLAAKTFEAGGTLNFTTTQFEGGYQPITVELWILLGTSLAAAAPERSLFTTEPAMTALRLTPRVASDGDDRLSFVIGQEGDGTRESFVFGEFIDQPTQTFHVVAVYRRTPDTVFDAEGLASDMALYVNGVSASTTGTGSSTAIADVMQNLVIGGDLGSDGAGAVFDEFAIYTHELSANDVARHYAVGLGGSCE